MAMPQTSAPAPKTQWLLTPKARLSFANLDRPRVSRFDSSKSGYSCVLIFEPPTDLSALKMMVWEVGKAAWGDAKARDPSVIWPFKPLTPDHKSMPGFPEGSVAVNLQSQFPPSLCDQARNPILANSGVIYSGCYVWVMTNAFAWERAGRRGVSLGLGNMQKIADGPRLDNRRTIEQDFQPLPGAEVPSGRSPEIPF